MGTKRKPLRHLFHMFFMTVETSIDGSSVANSKPAFFNGPAFDIVLAPGRTSKLKLWGNGLLATDFFSMPRLSFVGDSTNALLKCLLDHHFIRSLVAPPLAGDDSISPVVFFGDSGTGKTSLAVHLMSQLVDYSESGDDPNPQALYFSGSDFYRFYLAANERQDLDEFRQRILNSKGLLIDDLDQLAGKIAAQRELKFMIDSLIEMNKPVVATLKQSPYAAVTGILPELTSRLGGGVLFPVHAPGEQARMRLLKQLSDTHCIQLTDAALTWVSDKLPVTFPKLNHFFVQLKTELNARKDFDPFARVDVSTLAVIFQHNPSALETMATQILEIVAQDFELQTSALKSQSRKQTVVIARGIGIYLERTMLGTSFKKIGNRYGNRDHTTIMHSYQKFDSIVRNADKHQTDSKEDRQLKQILALQQKLNESFAGQMTLIC